MDGDQAAQARHPVHTRDEALTKRLVEWAQRKLGDMWLHEGFQAVRGDLPNSEDDFFLPLLMHHYQGATEPRGTIVSQFLASQPHLTPPEQELLKIHAAARLSVYCIAESVPGERMLLQDRLHGGEFWVQERTASHSPLQSHLLGRLVEVDGTYRLLGNSVHGLLPHSADHVVEWMRQRFPELTVDVVNGSEGSFALTRFWYDAVKSEARRPMPRIVNSAGEDTVLVRDRFTFSADRATVERALADLPGVELDASGAGSLLVGGVVHASFEWSSKGDLVVHTNSEARADTVQTMLADLALPGFRRARRQRSEVTELVPRGDDEHEEHDEPATVTSIRRHLDEHWLNDKVPALGNLTPRQAAETPEGRASLNRLLLEFEQADAGLPPARRTDVVWLREQLGL